MFHRLCVILPATYPWLLFIKGLAGSLYNSIYVGVSTALRQSRYVGAVASRYVDVTTSHWNWIMGEMDLCLLPLFPCKSRLDVLRLVSSSKQLLENRSYICVSEIITTSGMR